MIYDHPYSNQILILSLLLITLPALAMAMAYHSNYLKMSMLSLIGLQAHQNLLHHFYQNHINQILFLPSRLMMINLVKLNPLKTRMNPLSHFHPYRKTQITFYHENI